MAGNDDNSGENSLVRFVKGALTRNDDPKSLARQDERRTTLPEKRSDQRLQKADSQHELSAEVVGTVDAPDEEITRRVQPEAGAPSTARAFGGLRAWVMCEGVVGHGAEIYVRELDLAGNASVLGIHTFSDVPVGTYTVEVSIKGYSEQKRITVVDGKVAWVRFFLGSR